MGELAEYWHDVKPILKQQNEEYRYKNYDKYDKRGKHYIVEYKDEDDDDE